MREKPCIICKQLKPLRGYGSLAKCCLECADMLIRKDEQSLAKYGKKMNIKNLQAEVGEVFRDAFSRTPLKHRLEDIFGGVMDLYRATEVAKLKEKTGDSLASLIQLCNERDWDVEELIGNTLLKVRERMSQYRTLTRKTTVAIIGGAFDPIHAGHVSLGELILSSSRIFDEVWYMPCYAHVNKKLVATPIQRCEMVSLAIENNPRMRLFDYEIRNKMSGKTYDFVKKLLEEDFNSLYDFSWVIGQDDANQFKQWHESELLREMIRFVVVPRSGFDFDVNAIWYLDEPHIYLHAEQRLPMISSTEVRDCLEKEKDLTAEDMEGYLSKEVFDYAKKNKLYGL